MPEEECKFKEILIWCHKRSCMVKEDDCAKCKKNKEDKEE